MDSPVRFTRPLLAFAIGVPLAWAVLLWFHPNVDPNHVYADLRDNVVAYQVVHAGTLVFIGLLGLALYLLVRDLPIQSLGDNVIVGDPGIVASVGSLAWIVAVVA